FISGGGLGFLQQRSNALGGLCTLTQPVAYALLVDGQASFTTGSDRVAETNAVSETAIASGAAVSNSQVVEGAYLGAYLSKTNGYHVNIVSCIRVTPTDSCRAYSPKGRVFYGISQTKETLCEACSTTGRTGPINRCGGGCRQRSETRHAAARRQHAATAQTAH